MFRWALRRAIDKVEREWKNDLLAAAAVVVGFGLAARRPHKSRSSRPPTFTP